MGRLVFLDVLRGVEDLATVGAGVLLPHLVDHVPVGPQTHLVPELLHTDGAVLPVPLSQVGGSVSGQPALRDGNVTTGLTDQGVLTGMLGSEVVLRHTGILHSHSHTRHQARTHLLPTPLSGLISYRSDTWSLHSFSWLLSPVFSIVSSGSSHVWWPGGPADCQNCLQCDDRADTSVHTQV